MSAEHHNIEFLNVSLSINAYNEFHTVTIKENQEKRTIRTQNKLSAIIALFQ